MYEAGCGFDFDARRWRGWGSWRPLGGRRPEAKPSAAPRAGLPRRAAGAGASSRPALGVGLRGLGARVAPAAAISTLEASPADLLDELTGWTRQSDAAASALVRSARRVGTARRPGVGFSTKRMLEIVTRHER